MYLLMVVGLVDGTPTRHDGRYVRYYDPGPDSYPPHQCYLVTTAIKVQAKLYPTHSDALTEWQRIDPRQPTRPDGRPNRPLTAYTCEIVRADLAPS